MDWENRNKPQYEWQIVLEEDGEELVSLYQGHESETALSRLFAMWTQDRGNFSQWSNRHQFGGIIARYSDLSKSTIAVWLGLEPDELPEPNSLEKMLVLVDCEITCKLEGPNGNPMILKRINKK